MSYASSSLCKYEHYRRIKLCLPYRAWGMVGDDFYMYSNSSREREADREAHRVHGTRLVGRHGVRARALRERVERGPGECVAGSRYVNRC